MPRNSYRFKEDDSKKTILLIGILLVLILIVGGGLVLLLTQRAPAGDGQPPPPPPPQNLSNETGDTNATVECGDQCLMDAAVDAKNHSACGLIENTSVAQECYEALAMESLDACREVEDSAVLRDCVTYFAEEESDASLCDLLTAGRVECRLAVDPCIDSEDLGLCMALLNEDPSECGKDTSCLLNYSLTAKDSEACSLIQDGVIIKACQSAVLRSDRCSALYYDAQRDLCYQMFAIYSDDYLTCTQISRNSVYAVDCYSIFAARLGNSSLCVREDLGLNERWYCLTNYTLLTGDLQGGCGKIDKLAATNLFRCSFEYAKKYGDPAGCQLIGTSSSRAVCYEGAIMYSNQNLDWHYCGAITNFDWMNKCYVESAKIEGDASICDKISDQYSARSCRDSVAANQSKSQ